MAKPAWIKTTPAESTGNGNLSISGNTHSGRVQRTGTVTVQNQNGTKPSKPISVVQSGAAQKMTLITTTPPVVPAAGGVAQISLKGNVSAFGLICDNSVAFVGSLGYKINGGVAQVIDMEGFGDGLPTITIPGDPGASAEYDLTFIVTIPANPTPTQQNINYGIAPVNGDTWNGVQSHVTLQPGASILSVNKTSVTIPASGTAQVVAIESNDTWKVS